MVTSPSAKAFSPASEPRSTVSLSSYRPNLVMWTPRIQTLSPLSLMCVLPLSNLLVAERNRFVAVLVGARGERRHPHRHTEFDGVGVGLGVDQVGLHHATPFEV